MFDKIKQTYATLKDIWFPNNLDKMTRDLEEINKSMDDHIAWFRKEIEDLDAFIMSEDSDSEHILFD